MSSKVLSTLQTLSLVPSLVLLFSRSSSTWSWSSLTRTPVGEKLRPASRVEFHKTFWTPESNASVKFFYNVPWVLVGIKSFYQYFPQELQGTWHLFHSNNKNLEDGPNCLRKYCVVYVKVTFFNEYYLRKFTLWQVTYFPRLVLLRCLKPHAFVRTWYSCHVTHRV